MLGRVYLDWPSSLNFLILGSERWICFLFPLNPWWQNKGVRSGETALHNAPLAMSE